MFQTYLWYYKSAKRNGKTSIKVAKTRKEKKMFENLNKTSVSTIKEGIDFEKMEFKKLRDFLNMELVVDGFFINKGNFGEQVTVIANGYKINMPKRAVEQFKTIRDNEEMLNAVLTGHLKLTNIKTLPTKSGITVSYTLTDC